MLHVLVAQATPTPDQAASAIALAGLTAFVFAVVGFTKALRNREWNAVATTGAWWVGGIAAVLIFKQSAWAASVTLANHNLAGASFWDAIVIGIVPGSFGIVLNEGKKAIDNTQTTLQSPLIHAAPPAPVVATPTAAVPEHLQTVTADEAFAHPDATKPPTGV